MVSQVKTTTTKTAAMDTIRANAVILVLVLIIVALSVASPYFLTVGNIMDVAKQASINGIIALGMTYVITTGGIDLSVGSTWALSGVVGALLMKAGVPWPVALLGCIAVGSLCGYLSGLLVTRGRLQPFIATLATMNVYRGIALIITGGYTVYGLPADFRFIGGGVLFSIIPMPVIVLLLIFVVSWFIFRYQVLGRYLTAIGNNREAARLTGINVNRMIVMAYVYSGLLAAIGGGILATARISAAEPTIGSGAELDAIAAVVLGGTSMAGGNSRVFGTLIGAILLSAINNGLTLLNVPTYYKIAVIGLIIIAAMLIDSFGKETRD
ncbi:MAG: ABC transporter permease [Planctomycetaceae bacterium]|nr:ABC transporter permease [Planctomycetaceae bacterium]